MLAELRLQVGAAQNDVRVAVSDNDHVEALAFSFHAPTCFH